MERFNEKKVVLDIAQMVKENKSDMDMYSLSDMIKKAIYEKYGWTKSATNFANYKLNLLVANLYKI